MAGQGRTDAGSAPHASVPSSPSSSPESPARNDAVRTTGFDPRRGWFNNYVRLQLGQMTPEGEYRFREWAMDQNKEQDCARCERDRDWLFRHSPTVRFLSQKLAELNGSLDATNVLCVRCPSPGPPTPAGAAVDGAAGAGKTEASRRSAGMSGGFDPEFGIVLCANQSRDRKHLEDTLAHEMVHAYDHLRFKVDWRGEKGLEQAACTEIRAAMLSGECRLARELRRGNWGLAQQFQRCVRMRAIQSVMARPTCENDLQATKVVNSVWDSCFADTRPFDEIYR